MSNSLDQSKRNLERFNYCILVKPKSLTRRLEKRRNNIYYLLLPEAGIISFRKSPITSEQKSQR